MPDFHRTSVTDTSFIRGAGRLLYADITIEKPKKIEDVIDLGEVAVEAGVNEKQKVTVKAKKGNFKLTVIGNQTGNIKWNASAAEVKAALEALPMIVPGDVLVTGGPGDEGGTTPYVIEFTGNYAAQNIDTIVADKGTLEEPGTVEVATEVSGKAEVRNVTKAATYDAQTGWIDMGATKTGIQITINNAEESFDVDQILGDIASEPTSWECSVGTQLAEFTPEKMQLVWEGSAISIDTTPKAGPEKEIGFGQPVSYKQRRLAVLFQRPNGKIRGYFFHKVQRSPQESSITHAKTGEQISIPARFKALADTTESDIYKRFFRIRDQAIV